MSLQSERKQLNILIIFDEDKNSTISLAKKCSKFLLDKQIFRIFLKSSSIQNPEHFSNEKPLNIDHIICIGSFKTFKNTVSEWNSTFQETPIIYFADQDEPLGFGFISEDFPDVLENYVYNVTNKSLSISNYISFNVEFERSTSKNNFSFQMQIRRSMTKSVLKLKIYIFIQQKQYIHLADVWGDGLLISTPLGSIHKNISLDGPIVYPSIQTLIIVPLNPLSLKFRPIILPSNVNLMIEVDENSRSQAQILLDQDIVCSELKPTRKIFVKKSNTMLKLVTGLQAEFADQEWIQNIRDTFRWGEQYSNIHHFEHKGCQLEGN